LQRFQQDFGESALRRGSAMPRPKRWEVKRDGRSTASEGHRTISATLLWIIADRVSLSYPGRSRRTSCQKPARYHAGETQSAPGDIHKMLFDNDLHSFSEARFSVHLFGVP